MATRIPKRLRLEPLVEAVWQVHFEPSSNRPLGDILPGVLFTSLRNQIPNLQLNRLPVADIPPPVAALDPNLRHAPKYRIEAPEWPFLFQAGDRVITINCRQPYMGWGSFKAKICELVDVLEYSGLIPEPLQHSLRYIDLLTLESPPILSSLRMSLNIGENVITDRPLQLRVELPDQDCLHVLQIVTPAQVRVSEGEKLGSLIDLETIAILPQKNWPSVRDGLEILHTASKTMFFRQVLTSEAIERMKPEY